MGDQADMIETPIRRQWILEQRRKGMTMREIAEAAHQKYDEAQLPKNYDHSHVSKDIQRALDRVREEVEEIAADYRDLEISRYETLLSELWPYAQEHTEEVVEDGKKIEVRRKPDTRIVDRVLAIMDRLERLYDVDEAPPLPSNPGSDDTNFFVQVNQKLKSDE